MLGRGDVGGCVASVALGASSSPSSGAPSPSSLSGDDADGLFSSSFTMSVGNFCFCIPSEEPAVCGAASGDEPEAEEEEAVASFSLAAAAASVASARRDRPEADFATFFFDMVGMFVDDTDQYTVHVLIDVAADSRKEWVVWLRCMRNEVVIHV